jgi:endo-1,4-beta-xylanase
MFFTNIVFLLSSFLILNCSKEEEKKNILAIKSFIALPTASSASCITSSSFVANWSLVQGATGYQIDVSTKEDFSTFIDGYKSLLCASNSVTVSGISQNITYYYRIRTVKNSELSKNSNVMSAISVFAEDTTFLKLKANALTDPFLIGMGAVITPQLISGTPYDTVLKNEFSSISAAYEMKMDVLWEGIGKYNWTAADKIVKYGNDNNINVHGHTLIWYQSAPKWLKEYTGSNADFRLEVKRYITDVVTHFAGKVRSWDVVNEGVEDIGSNLRNDIFLQRMGPNYIKDCFQWARDAAIAAGDTNLLLFYNDYATCTYVNKQNKVYEIVDDLKASNLIDGLGFQMHNTYLLPTKEQIETDINRAVAKGLKIHISELDIQVNPFNDITCLTPDRNLLQKAKYREIVKLYNALPKENKYAITVWGFKDDESWIRFFLPINHPGDDWPLLYDKNFKVKSAHTGFLEGLD